MTDDISQVDHVGFDGYVVVAVKNVGSTPPPTKTTSGKPLTCILPLGVEDVPPVSDDEYEYPDPVEPARPAGGDTESEGAEMPLDHASDCCDDEFPDNTSDCCDDEFPDIPDKEDYPGALSIIPEGVIQGATVIDVHSPLPCRLKSFVSSLSSRSRDLGQQSPSVATVMAPKDSQPVQQGAGSASVEPERPAERSPAPRKVPWFWGESLVDPEHLRVCAERTWREPNGNPM